MLRAIRAVGEGEAIFSPAVAVRLADYFANSIRPSAPPDAFPSYPSGSARSSASSRAA